jgi:hypothetical protein
MGCKGGRDAWGRDHEAEPSINGAKCWEAVKTWSRDVL